MERRGSGRHDADDGPGLGVYSPAMQQLAAVASRVAEVDSTVLIIGESGVGKERLARFIHEASPRAAGSFVPVNCGALPDALFESELFGHARGAFTGALHERTGLFEAAHRGTLRLDEIGEMPLSLQVKLPRVLQDQEIRRVGENRQRRGDVRVIAATNRNLVEDVAQRRFRRDLYYRLRVVELLIPPLRERREDLCGLAHLLLTRIARHMHRPVTGYTPQALEQLLRYPWPVPRCPSTPRTPPVRSGGTSRRRTHHPTPARSLSLSWPKCPSRKCGVPSLKPRSTDLDRPAISEPPGTRERQRLWSSVPSLSSPTSRGRPNRTACRCSRR